MSTIKINFDLKSLKRAIKQVDEINRKFKKNICPTFIKKCLIWIKDRANTYLQNINMDGEIITDIQNSWSIEAISNNVMRLVNTSRKAVFVEFGVGVVGQQNSHPEANGQSYEYNKPSRFKHSDGRWYFNAQHKQYAIDLNEGYFAIYQRENSGKIVAVTKGSPANLYLYNSAMDLLSTGTHQTLWAETLKETI